jgi:hypothetical protein
MKQSRSAPIRRVTASGAALSLIAAGLIIGIPASNAATGFCTDLLNPSGPSYIGATSGTYTCEVPAGVSAYTYVVRGANGGGLRRAATLGGAGAKITGTLPVTSGEILSITVGGNGGVINPGPGGGGGGGYSSIARGAVPVLVAGGGGGDGEGAGSAVNGGAGGTTTPSTGETGDSSQYACGGNGAVDGVGGSGGTSFEDVDNNCPQPTTSSAWGVGGDGGDTGANGEDAYGSDFTNSFGGGGGGGFGGVGGSHTPGVAYPYLAPGGSPGAGGAAAAAGGGGGGYGGGGGAGGIGSGGGAGGGGGSSLVPAGAVAVATFADLTDRAPRVEFPTAVSAPTIITVGPSSGPTSGTTLATITGTGFQDGATVTIGGNPCTPVTFVSSTSLTCTTTANDAGVFGITVVNPDATTVTAPDAFTYVATPVSARCPQKIVKARPANRKLPLNVRVVLVKRIKTVPECKLKISDSGLLRSPAKRGDIRPPVSFKVNKSTGKVTARARYRNAKASIQTIARPVDAPYNKSSDSWVRTWRS